MEWHLSDFQLGIIGTAFTLVYAIAGLPLGGWPIPVRAAS